MVIRLKRHTAWRTALPLAAGVSFLGIAVSGTIPGPAPANAAPAAKGPTLAPASVARGQELFGAMCFSCHGTKLEGGEGPKLTDAEWLHGGTRDQIMQSIHEGFPQKGMPPFGAMYGPNDLGALADYILSRQLGWRSASVTVRSLPEGVSKSFDFNSLSAIEPVQKATYDNGLVEFAPAKGLPAYAITFEGDVMVPEGAEKQLLAGGHNKYIRWVRVDGKEVESVGNNFGALYPLPTGTHNVSITYVSPGGIPEREYPLLITENKGTYIVGPLSKGGKDSMDLAMRPISAKERIRIFERPVVSLPPKTISVGFPSGLNYAFNPTSCSVVGAWRGDFLNIGPAVTGRGTFPSEPLGAWIFNNPRTLKIGNGECRYQSMSTLGPGGAPEFRFTLNGQPHKLVGTEQDGGVQLTITREAATGQPLPVELPAKVPGVAKTGEVTLAEQKADMVRIMIR